jgi:hypothetical protein
MLYVLEQPIRTFLPTQTRTCELSLRTLTSSCPAIDVYRHNISMDSREGAPRPTSVVETGDILRDENDKQV